MNIPNEGNKKTQTWRRGIAVCIAVVAACSLLFMSNSSYNTTYGKLRQPKFDVTQCYDVVRTQRPLYSRDDFKIMQEAYRRAVDPEDWSISDKRVHGFHVAFGLRYIPGKGRGVVAAEAVPKGTFVWSDVQSATFPEPNGQVSFMHFLTLLPPGMACDIMQWAYAYTNEGETITAVELDEGAMINNARGGPKNLASVHGGYKASRDIEEGEEFIMEYDDFVELDEHFWFNELWDVAFFRGDDDDDEYSEDSEDDSSDSEDDSSDSNDDVEEFVASN